MSQRFMLLLPLVLLGAACSPRAYCPLPAGSVPGSQPVALAVPAVTSAAATIAVGVGPLAPAAAPAHSRPARLPHQRVARLLSLSQAPAGPLRARLAVRQQPAARQQSGGYFAGFADALGAAILFYLLFLILVVSVIGLVLFFLIRYFVRRAQERRAQQAAPAGGQP